MSAYDEKTRQAHEAMAKFRDRGQSPARILSVAERAWLDDEREDAIVCVRAWLEQAEKEMRAEKGASQ